MAKPITISVTGYTEINRDPERAVLSFAVIHKAAEQTTASSNIVQTSKAVQELLETYAPKLPTGEATSDAAITHWSMTNMSTSSYQDQIDKTTVFEATTSFTAKFRDFDKLGSVSSTLSVIPNVSIKSIRWMLTDATISSLVSECRISAAHNALEKARDYAKAFGYQDVQPYEISDNGYGLPVASSASMMRSRKIMRGVRHEEQLLLTFRPEEVSMNSSVTVKFNVV
ncbi:hypothetical protein AJ78_05695 [Emergomyces pasteurianus Ep9510]|uniref:SIMPL domain-containing protein n=1 Tax=Emergomyces pasteurianus Ep9510 TaxID=1447872 RepID=A0A1J9PBI1_9EURO|nr:hypothetical protein AJ78_05695 [Emergomyces pasteurianus Ep9510]